MPLEAAPVKTAPKATELTPRKDGGMRNLGRGGIRRLTERDRGRKFESCRFQLIPRCAYKIVVVMAYKNFLAVENPGSVYERTGTEPGAAEVYACRKKRPGGCF